MGTLIDFDSVITKISMWIDTWFIVLDVLCVLFVFGCIYRKKDSILKKDSITKKDSIPKCIKNFFRGIQKPKLLCWFMVVILVCFLIHLILLPQKVVNISNDVAITTTTTTVFTTLMTVNLTLVALAVTAYIFLRDVSGNRQPYEQNAVRILLKKNTSKLICLTAATGICVVACLIVDNSQLSFLDETSWFQYLVAAASSMDVVALIVFIYEIIDFENNLKKTAEKEIGELKKKLKQAVNDKIKKLEKELKQKRELLLDGEEIPKDEIRKQIGDIETFLNQILKNCEKDKDKIVKQIGDIETFIDQILTNHEAEYHAMQTEMSLSTVIGSKLDKIPKDKRKTILMPNEFCEAYNDLIELRDYLLMQHQSNGEKNDSPIDQEKNDLAVGQMIKIILAELSRNYISNEILGDISISDIDFAEKSNLDNSSFRNAAIINCKLKDCELETADFTGSVLTNLDISGSDCKNAVFTDVKFTGLKISKEAKFSNAVFREADLSVHDWTKLDEDEYEENKYKQHDSVVAFDRTSCDKVNFLGSKFYFFDFSFSVFTNAQFTNAVFEKCTFDSSNFTGALFIGTRVNSGCAFKNANLGNLTAARSKWNGKKPQKTEKNALANTINLSGSRMAQANFAGAEFSYCNFLGVYANDASFVGATFEKCHLGEMFAPKSDFTNAKLSNCSFSNSNLSYALLISHRREPEEQKKIKTCWFNRTTMTNVQIKNRIFIDCEFKQAIFDEALFQDVSFIRCDFKDTQFDGAVFMNVQMIDCKNVQLEKFEKSLRLCTEQDRLLLRTRK